MAMKPNDLKLPSGEVREGYAQGCARSAAKADAARDEQGRYLGRRRFTHEHLSQALSGLVKPKVIA